MNDWKIKKFLIVILSIQFTVWGLIGLDAINIHIPILRQLICFIYLTFIPGIIILRILRIHNLGSIETILYSVGLSLAFLMFIGLFINTFYPIFGILDPISSIPLIFTISLFTVLLLSLSHLMDKEYSVPDITGTNEYSLVPLLLCLLPFLSIFGTYLMNLYGNNVIQMALLLIISLMPLLVLKRIPEKFYPLVVFIISISLLFHTVLISSYIWGADINGEYFFANLVLITSHWNPTIYNDVNAMLSVVLLAPIYSIFLNLNLNWIFKIIYPALFSLVPLGLFVIFKKETSNKIAILASIFFMFTYVFYTVMPALGREEIAELFVVLLVILVLDKRISKISKSFLLIIFASSLIVSHYGTAYIFMIIVVLAIIISLLKIPKISKFQNYKNNLIVGSFMLFFIVLTVSWYLYVSDSSIFNVGANIGSNILNSITDLMNPATSQGAYIIESTYPLFQSIERYLNIIAEIFIGIGILNLIFSKNKFNPEYKLLSISAFMVAMAGIIIPFFAAALNSDRLFTITLIILAPFFVIGFVKSFEILSAILNKILKKKKLIDAEKFLPIVSLFLVIFFLFSSAFIYQIFDTTKEGSFAINNNVDFYNLKDPEIASIEWIKDYSDLSIMIYADLYHTGSILSITNRENSIEQIQSYSFKKAEMNYIFISKYNIKYNKMYIQETNNLYNYTSIIGLNDNTSTIYDDGGSEILVGEGGYST